MPRKYSYEAPNGAKVAKAHAMALHISAKDAVEVVWNIRGLPVAQAEDVLSKVIYVKTPIRFRRYNTEVGHKPGIGPARFPVNAAQEVLTILLNAKGNAKAKGLDEKRLYVVSAVANRSVHKRPGTARAFAKGPSNRSRRASVEIVLEERVR